MKELLLMWDQREPLVIPSRGRKLGRLQTTAREMIEKLGDLLN